MNTFGIDYQQTLSVICLHEGLSSTIQPHSVGDGMRPLIPNTVLGEKLWGSQALLAADPDRLCGGEMLHDGPWLNDPGASIFWSGLYQRLSSYVGRVRPISQNGYQVVVSLHTAEYQAASAAVERLCHTAGLSDARCIPATEALLCRWMAEQPAHETAERLVAVVAVGDVSILIRAYGIRHKAGHPPHVVVSGQPVSLARTGLAWWVARILDLVHARVHEPIPPGYELALRDAVIEFGARLGRASAGQLIEWTGLFHQRMYAPPKLTRHDCKRWPEVEIVDLSLPVAIRDAVSAVRGRAQPDLIIVGGVGAMWPFARDASTAVGPVWQSDIPQEDIASGAALWPLIGECSIDVLRDSSTPALGPATKTDTTVQHAAELVDPGIRVDQGILPPWKRHEWPDC